MKHQVFVDLDGVLADYEAGFLRQFGCTTAELEARGENLWDAIGSVPDFYENLEPFESTHGFWGELEELCVFHGIDPVVLTSAGETYFSQCARSKRRWVEKHLGEHVLFVPVKGGRRKASYAQRATDVLIDDWHPNCVAWGKAGGTAILHTHLELSYREVRALLVNRRA